MTFPPGGTESEGSSPSSGPEHGRPDYRSPERGGSDSSAPGYGGGYSPPGYTPPEYKAPEYQAPEYKAPEYKAPEYKAPEYTAPDRQASESDADEARSTDRSGLGDSAYAPPSIGGSTQAGTPQPDSQQSSGSHQSAGSPQQTGASGASPFPLDALTKSKGDGGLPRILSLVVLVLGVVGFLLGLLAQYVQTVSFGGPSGSAESSNNFFEPIGGDPTAIALLLVAGLVAGAGLLPKQTRLFGLVAALAVSGFAVAVFQAFNVGAGSTEDEAGFSYGLGAGAIAVLIIGFLQAAAAVAALLFSSGVIKAPAARPSSYGQQNPSSGQGFGQVSPQQGWSSQPGAQPGQQGSFGQGTPGQYGSSQGQGQPGYGSQAPGSQGYGSPSPSSQGYGSPGAQGAGSGYGPPSSQGYRSSSSQGYGSPSSQGPGSRGFGSQGPGSQGYGSQGPGSQGYGSQGPGSQGYGLQGPGSQGYGSQAPGSQGYGSQGPGSQGQGYGSPAYGSLSPSPSSQVYASPGYGSEAQQRPESAPPSAGQQQGFSSAPQAESGYSPPSYRESSPSGSDAQTGRPSQDTGSLGRPTGTADPAYAPGQGYTYPESTGVATGQAQHAAPADRPEGDEPDESTPYGAPTRAFDTTPTSEDKN